MVNIRLAVTTDSTEIWDILEPIFRAGETYAIARSEILGTYSLRANQRGGGAHVSNCGYITATNATGRGIAKAMCLHSKEQARRSGFRAMQFNFVVSANQRAVKLWQSLGFEIVGRLPAAFHHPSKGYVDALVMFATLAQ